MMLVTALDDIAWLLNLRGNDIDYNPVFFSYVILHKDAAGSVKVDLFIDADKVSEPEIKTYLESNNVTVFDYHEIETVIKKYAKEATKKISVDSSQCNFKLYDLLKTEGYELVEQSKLLQHMKAAKNKVQQEGMRQCNIRDCAAIMKYFAFLEEELKKPDHGIDEYTGARKVEEYRTHGDLYKGPSFDTISSIGANGAVIHYKPE